MNSVADRDRALAAFKKRFAEKVKALRAERRLTLEEFSSPTPYSGQTISNYIRKPDAYIVSAAL